MFARSTLLSAIIIAAVLFSGCIRVKDQVATPKLLKTENAEMAYLTAEIDRFAKVTSMRAKIGLKFEDNSFAENGIAEKYKTASGEVVVQRPANILLKVQVPIIGTDIAQMASNGEKFQIAILQDGGDGRFKKFLRGTNDADYSILQAKVKSVDLDSSKVIKQQVNAFSNLRPQHFTDALMVRPVAAKSFMYTMSTILQEEVDMKLLKEKSPSAWILHGYYLLDEYARTGDQTGVIKRRFWFDRVGGIRLARQQVFDAKGEIESDIVYGREGALGGNPDYGQLPLEITLTRPKEKYKMTLTYSSPDNVTLGKAYKTEAFDLKNDFGLEELDLDQEVTRVRSGLGPSPAASGITKGQ